MQIDHIFMMVQPDRRAELDLAARAGLIEAYRRVHPGQGTRNICYAFPDLYLELLWVEDPSAASSPAIQRTGLLERWRWRETGACPLGIAWRAAPAPFPTWPYTPPYLPDGMTIPVANDSDDLKQPLMFHSPGDAAPLQWPLERQGAFRHICGWAAGAGRR